MPTFYEFFAGGGMARAGLGTGWECLFANDFDRRKSNIYCINWGSEALRVADVRRIAADHIPAVADLAWASFPCQDLSLAGGGAGLQGDRSGTFWPFWNIIRSLIDEGRGPRSIVLENVVGALTSHGGGDFTSLCGAIASSGYSYGAVVIDARSFVPQSRPRLFFVAFRADVPVPNVVSTLSPNEWHPRALVDAHARLSDMQRNRWRWWNMPSPPLQNMRFADLIEDEPADVSWHTADETGRLLAMMSAVNLRKVETVRAAGIRAVGAVYRRTRVEDNVKVQRAEVRFDNLAGCLRTPAGGSSRQIILVVDGQVVRSRLISARETARLMGLPDSYKLPIAYNEAYHLTGDGVAVPVVRHLARHLLEPVLVGPSLAAEAA
jgi:DNA (cytosine-5)-methyltransferase 1